MFVILNIVETGKRKIKRGKTISSVKDVMTTGGERFYIVDVCDSEKGVNWDEVSYFIGKHSKKVLIDRHYNFPEFTPLDRFDPINFKNIILFNTLEMILREMYLSGMRIRCVINDSLALYPSYLSKIVRFSAQTTVVTKNDFRYFSEVRCLYSRYGAGITVTEHMPVIDKNTIILDVTGDYENKGNGYLFSAEKCIRPLSVEGFNHLKSLCPAYIEPIDFLGAVYEMNHDKSLKQAFCSGFMYNGEKRSVSDIITDLKGKLNLSFDSNKSIIFYV